MLEKTIRTIFAFGLLLILLPSCQVTNNSETKANTEETEDAADEGDETEEEEGEEEKKTESSPTTQSTATTPSTGASNLPMPETPFKQQQLKNFIQKSRADKLYDEANVKDQSRTIIRLYEPMLQPEPSALSSTEAFLMKLGTSAHWVFFEIAFEMIEKLEQSKGKEDDSRNKLIIYTNALKLTADSLDKQMNQKIYLPLAKSLYQDVMETFIKYKFK